MVRAILFDVDGVLFDSDQALVEAFQHSFRKFGFPSPHREDILVHAGKTGHSWIRALLPKSSLSLVDQVHDYHARIYAERFLPRQVKLMPNARETLLTLHALGIRQGVVTNMPRWILDMAFRRFQLEGLFDTLLSAEDLATPKPSGQPLRTALQELGIPAQKAFYVGDTAIDVLTARHAGVRVVLLNHPRNKSVGGAWRRIKALPELISLALKN